MERKTTAGNALISTSNGWSQPHRRSNVSILRISRCRGGAARHDGRFLFSRTDRQPDCTPQLRGFPRAAAIPVRATAVVCESMPFERAGRSSGMFRRASDPRRETGLWRWLGQSTTGSADVQRDSAEDPRSPTQRRGWLPHRFGSRRPVDRAQAPQQPGKLPLNRALRGSPQPIGLPRSGSVPAT